jgi:hypothetical protein
VYLSMLSEKRFENWELGNGKELRSEERGGEERVFVVNERLISDR